MDRDSAYTLASLYPAPVIAFALTVASPLRTRSRRILKDGFRSGRVRGEIATTRGMHGVDFLDRSLG